MGVRKVAAVIQRIALVIAALLHLIYLFAYMAQIDFGMTKKCEDVFVKDYCLALASKFKYFDDPEQTMKLASYVTFTLLYYLTFIVADVFVIIGAVTNDPFHFFIPTIYHTYAFIRDFHLLYFSDSSVFLTIFFIRVTILISMLNLSSKLFNEQRQNRPERNANRAQLNRNIPTVRVPQPGAVV